MIDLDRNEDDEDDAREKTLDVQIIEMLPLKLSIINLIGARQTFAFSSGCPFLPSFLSPDLNLI